MSVIKFPYRKEQSHIFGVIYRPIASADFWSNRFNRWIRFTLIVDTGADYTIFPYSKSIDLGVDLDKDCCTFETSGIGGSETVYLLKKMKMKLGNTEFEIPVGFLERDDIPPLLGRARCLDKLKVMFFGFNTYLSER